MCGKLSPVFPPPSSAIDGGWPILHWQKQVVEDAMIFGENDGCHLKLAFERVNLLLKIWRKFRHLLPLFNLLEKLNQTAGINQVQPNITNDYLLLYTPQIKMNWGTSFNYTKGYTIH